jgi:hypothetical protein
MRGLPIKAAQIVSPVVAISSPEPKLIKNQLCKINCAVDNDEDQDKKQNDPTGDAEIPKHIT